MRYLIFLILVTCSVDAAQVLCNNNYELHFDIPKLQADPNSGFYGKVSVDGRNAEEIIFTTNEQGSLYRFKAQPSEKVIEQLKGGRRVVIEFEEVVNYLRWKTYRAKFSLE